MSNRNIGGPEGEEGDGPLRRASIRVVRRQTEGESELPADSPGHDPMVVVTAIEVQRHLREKPVPQRSTMWLAVLLVLSLLAFLSAGMMFVLHDPDDQMDRVKALGLYIQALGPLANLAVMLALAFRLLRERRSASPPREKDPPSGTSSFRSREVSPPEKPKEDDVRSAQAQRSKKKVRPPI